MSAPFQRKRSLLPVAPVLPLLGLAASEPVGLASWGSEPVTHTGDYTSENWQAEQGLPQVSITSIAQTPDGYLWVGTFNGLARFDGVRFTVFNHANTPALGSSRVVRLLTDREGGLWIMTQEGGLARLAEGRFTAYGPARGLPACGAAALVTDLEERQLVVDREGRLHRVEDGQLVMCQESPAGGEARLLVAPSEPCWVEVQGKATNSSQVPLRLPTISGRDPAHIELRVRCAVRSRTGGFWLAATSGVYRIKNGYLQGPATRFSQPLNAPVALAEDRQGNLWVGSWNEGLFRKDPTGQEQRFTAGAGLAENDLASLFVDRENNVWAGTFSGGLHRLKPRLFQCFDARDGLAGNNVMSVTADRQERLWLGINGGGLNCGQDGRFAPVLEPSEIRRYQLAYSVLADRQDAVWIGLYGAMALRLHAGTLTPYNLGDGSTSMTPRVLFEDRAGTIWLGCDNGLQRYDAGRFTLHTTRNGLAQDEVRALAEDRSGTLYVGTHGGGLNCFRSNRFTRYTKREGLPDNHIASLWVDRDDTLWIGTLYGGLSRFRQGRFATITTRDGLPSDTIGTLAEDDHGNLWLGSNRGIVRMNRRELNDYLDGQDGTLNCRLFNRSDGLNSIDCTGGGQPACCKTRDGRLWFATVKGLAVVDPDKLPFNSLPPPVVIEEVLLEDDPTVGLAKPIGAPGSLSPPRTGSQTLSNLVIPPGHHRLGFRFAGLSLVAPEKVRFRYRLEGLDNHWTDAGSQRTVSYAHLPPGTYRFEVTACNNDGVWNEAGAALPVTILPYVWQTGWFEALVLLILFGGATWSVHRVLIWRMQRRLARIKQEHAVERERARIAHDIHDDLGARLTQIGLLSALAKRASNRPEQVQSYVTGIADRTNETVRAMDEIVWAVDPAKDTLEGLLNYLAPLSEEFFEGTPIRCHLDIPLVLPSQPVSTKARHSLLLVAKEAMHNCLKHSGATQVWIRANLDESVLRIEIDDNGCGFKQSDAEAGGAGNGLRNMRRRVEELGGRFALISHPGEGAKIVFEVDLSRHGQPD